MALEVLFPNPWLASGKERKKLVIKLCSLPELYTERAAYLVLNGASPPGLARTISEDVVGETVNRLSLGEGEYIGRECLHPLKNILAGIRGRKHSKYFMVVRPWIASFYFS